MAKKSKAAKSTKSSPKSPEKTKKVVAESPRIAKPRMLKKPQYKSFRLHRPIKSHRPQILSSYKIFKRSIQSIKSQKKVFIGIVGVYLVLSLIFVKGFSSTLDIPTLKETFNSFYSGAGAQTAGTLALFGVLVGSSGANKGADGASVYQALVAIISILAILWVHRNPSAKNRIRDGFYKGMHPFVPLILVIGVISFQVIPFGFGSWLYSVTIQGGVAVTLAEKFAWLIVVFLLFLSSMYMIASSFFALIIVTLPNVQPMQALRGARELVRHRRWAAMRKLLFLPVPLLIGSGLVMFPFLLWAPAIAEWVFFIVSGFGWLVGVSYIYEVYMELLNEKA